MKRMLIDAAHPEEIRVAVLDGNQLEEFDVESGSRKQLKGNIYLAKVTRVEPSLQAAFVDYGGNRHGFLAFNEIHPDYYQIPIADRERLLAEQEEEDAEADRAEEEAERAAEEAEAAGETEHGVDAAPEPLETIEPATQPDHDQEHDDPEHDHEHDHAHDHADHDHEHVHEAQAEIIPPGETTAYEGDERDSESEPMREIAEAIAPTEIRAAPRVETVGGDEIDDAAQRRRPPQRAMRRYKIQEVIKRRQILLVQVVKEERGNKGAALTTFLSLAGRYCVLMPNTGKGGGISRKIGSGQDRKRLKSIISDLDVPDGMAVIVRTAGSDRGKVEIKRDYDYLLRLWSDIRTLTLQSTAPALIHAEANIINRAVRDLYARDIEEIVVEGDEAYRQAKDLMKMLIPSHAKKVQGYKDDAVPLFARYQIETQLESMNYPTVQLRSGGYIVMNATEALVAIDVNSGRATRGRNIEETALRTNTEAAVEIARQLRLRDLAGLIVIDFIDMDHSRNQIAVERKLKEAMRRDRARIQIGRISAFGLLELSRQRLRPSLAETVTEACPHCGGTGIRRSTESTALHVLRGIEEEGQKKRALEIEVAMPTMVALYLLNHKRQHLNEIEARFGMRILIKGDDDLIPPKYIIERTVRIEGAQDADEERRERQADGDGEEGRGRRRRRGRGRDRDDDERRNAPAGEGQRTDSRRESQADDEADDAEDDYELTEDDEELAAESEAGDADTAEDDAERPEREARDDQSLNQGERRNRRRGRRGGRGRNRERDRGRNDNWRPEAAGAAEEDTAERHADAERDREQVGERTGERDTAPQRDGAPQGEGGRRRRRRRVRRRGRDRDGAPVTGDVSLPASSEAGPTLWAATEDNFQEPQGEVSRRDEPSIVEIATEPERMERPEPAYTAPAPEPVRQPEPPREEEAPSGPPRSGWWQRLVK